MERYAVLRVLFGFVAFATSGLLLSHSRWAPQEVCFESDVVMHEDSATVEAAAYVPAGLHLVGSVPLGTAEEVFRTVAAQVGDRLRRVPDGETGPRADWIVWQYPVLSSRPQFEVAPPAGDFHRALPRLRLRDGEDASGLDFESLGYADAALSSYRTFSLLKRAGEIPRACRFQVCLPTPLAPISAFVALDNQADVEVRYESAMNAELARILDAIPHEQLALQWDTNFEFALLEGDLPAWFPDVKAGVLERLIRLSRAIPADVELGFHFCYGDGKDSWRRPPRDASRLVEISNALSSSLSRPLNWIHIPALPGSGGEFFEPLHGLRLHPETELYVGLLGPNEPDAATSARIQAVHEIVGEFGVASACGWGRHTPALVPALLALHAGYSRPIHDPGSAGQFQFAWPDGVHRIPDEPWVEQPVESFGLQYDTVENHGWYRNLDPTVEQLARDLHEGDVLIDYSGGTGILLDRLLLRVFDRQIGMMIVDSSPKFLRVALDRFQVEERVAFRVLRFLREKKRLQLLDEVVDPVLLDRGVDAIVSTNAIHLYYDLEDTLRSWARVLKPGGRVYINSGNLRNPRVRENDWIIDETVYVVHEVATGLVRTDPQYARYRDLLDDEERLARHVEFRDRVFLAPRPLNYYLEALRASGFAIDDVSERTIEADVQEWYEFLSAYHDAVLGWIGGTAKIDGADPPDDVIADRLNLMRHALDVIFGGRTTFRCCWTYITASSTGELRAG
jgi:ubiquinone/menaquinone biosynthesis C-methylase UbiE